MKQKLKQTNKKKEQLKGDKIQLSLPDMDIHLAKQLTGGLSNPTKMPCPAYSLPATACKVGSKLHEVENSICSDCYALKGRYMFNAVQEALTRRLDAITGERWVEAMSFLINRYCKDIGYFRWHDSGDIQSVDHLLKIIQICKNTPTIKHWLPTREYNIVRDTKKIVGTWPQNLIIRLSALMFGDLKGPVALAKKLQVGISGADSSKYNCPAHTTNNMCASCRECWDNPKKTIIYRQH